MTKQIINSHKLTHLVSKDFLVRAEGHSRHMHRILRVYNIIAKHCNLEARQHYKFGHYWRTQFGNTDKIGKN